MVELKTLKSKEGNLKGCPEKNLKESTLYVGMRVRGVKCKNYLFSDHGKINTTIFFSFGNVHSYRWEHKKCLSLACLRLIITLIIK